ncbi:hypothetical protein [Blastococcus sp. SYSU D00820]
MDEQVVAESGAVYCWNGPKMGATIFGTKLGKLVLTTQRLLFLSSKGSGAGHMGLQLTGIPGLGSQVSVSLDAEGSLAMPPASISRCEMGKKRALVVWTRGAGGFEAAHAFGGRMGMPEGHAWAAEINRLRGVVPQT